MRLTNIYIFMCIKMLNCVWQFKVISMRVNNFTRKYMMCFHLINTPKQTLNDGNRLHHPKPLVEIYVKYFKTITHTSVVYPQNKVSIIEHLILIFCYNVPNFDVIYLRSRVCYTQHFNYCIRNCFRNCPRSVVFI